jgi:hypothetical protein
MRIWLSLLLLPALSGADWKQFESQHFEMITDAREGDARTALTLVEQLRHAIGKTLGKPDLTTPAPLRIFLLRDPSNYQKDGLIQMGSEKLYLVLSPGQAEGTAFLQNLTRLLVETNVGRMPGGIEDGLLSLFTTIHVDKTRITIGTPPSKPDLPWALVHMLAVSEEFYGRLPTLLNNLGKGVPEDVAYRNSTGLTPLQMQKRAAAYLTAGKFATTQISGLPINPERDFILRTWDDQKAKAALAEVLAETEKKAQYLKLLEDARAASDDAFAAAALRRAVDLRPNDPAAYPLLAKREKDVKKQIEILAKATTLDRRDAGIWDQLAGAYLANRQFSDAYKAWLQAEQSAADTASRDRYRSQRLDIERQRLDHEEAERRRAAEEKEREIRELKAKAVAELRALEARANKEDAPRSPDEKVVEWWDGPSPAGKARGDLVRVDCTGKSARLHVKTAEGSILLIIRDPGQIVVKGKEQQAIGCGVQKPRPVVVEYFPKKDPKLGSAGDVATIEFVK